MTIDLDAIPRPAEVAIDDWLACFPAYASCSALRRAARTTCMSAFHARGLAAAVVGVIDDSGSSAVRSGHIGQPCSTSRHRHHGRRALIPAAEPTHDRGADRRLGQRDPHRLVRATRVDLGRPELDPSQRPEERNVGAAGCARASSDRRARRRSLPRSAPTAHRARGPGKATARRADPLPYAAVRVHGIQPDSAGGYAVAVADEVQVDRSGRARRDPCRGRRPAPGRTPDAGSRSDAHARETSAFACTRPGADAQFG